MKTILIDDDTKAIDYLEQLLRSKCPEVEVIAKFNNADTALVGIQNLRPDLIFLDIKMPGNMNGLDLLQQLQPAFFRTIFVTGHGEYLHRAIELSAASYLFKPVNPIKLKTAVEKARQEVNEKKLIQYHRELLDNYIHQSERLAVRLSDEIIFIALAVVLFVKGKGSHSVFYLQDGRVIEDSRNLKELEPLLVGGELPQNNKTRFTRISKQIILRNNAVLSYDKIKHKLKLCTGIELDIPQEISTNSLLQKLGL